MEQYAYKQPYNPFSPQEVEQVRNPCVGGTVHVPVTGTLTFGTPKGVSVSYPSEKVEPWDQVAAALAHLLCTVGDKLAGCIVLQCQTATYQAMVQAENAAITPASGEPDRTMSGDYLEHCLKKSVRDFCKKSYDP
jgi:hypothetical protein